MILTCFACNATGSIEAFTTDDAAGEFVNLAGNLPPSLWRALVAYISLFRASRKLAFTKALKLALETLALDADLSRLETALCETVEALRNKGGKPLKNHNYLKRVLENVRPEERGAKREDSLAPRSSDRGPALGKRAQAMQILAGWGETNDIRRAVAEGLSALVALNLDSAPGVGTIACTADVWGHVLQQAGVAIPEVDAARVRQAFSLLLGKSLKKWPEPFSLKELLPRRPDRAKLQEPPPTEEQMAQGREALKGIRQALRGK